MKKYRVVIVGAGIIGVSIARVLSMYENFDVSIAEMEPDVGWGISKANTSIIHPCHEEDPERYPLRARLCREGNSIWMEWVKELDILARWPGELMVFHSSEEEREARKYISFAIKNNVPGVQVIYRDELQSYEPTINPDAEGALYAPTAGMISPFEAVIAIAENAIENGVKLIVDTRVSNVKITNHSVVGVDTNRGSIDADIIINAAGLYADHVSHMAGVARSFYIKPRRGEYIVFDEGVDIKPKKILHTTPTPTTKGVYAITTVHGNLMIGPTAEDLPVDARESRTTTENGLSYLLKEGGRILNRVPPPSKIIRRFAGLRPEPPQGEWLIEVYTDPFGFVNVAGIRSPGLTAAPAIANYVLKLMIKKYDITLVKKASWVRHRKSINRIRELSLERLDELIRKNPSYGKIICHCRTVSEAEILEAIDRIIKIGVKPTVDGVKFRTTAGFGKCQGSFCRWRIALLISRKLDIPLHSVVIKRSPYGLGDVKLLLRSRMVNKT
ncbi:MAG: NAD(P)/FAD-dependent oxidoreductase [Ignisphaera sp.]|nr:NAD(P)/FAD-dependent oxidoreductase [Ignisphaera sp.]MCX8168378.1 NAD(P)/FAD-dependent oxidoreductase [Ignisphaera sp.]MDW8085790.1 NAD(P)/FAD-dependent oxidoreductase [Ignisphaera sp.]